MLDKYYEKRGVDRAYSAFKSKGYSDEWAISGALNQVIAMEALPPFLRVLLITDGTVTKSLEAFYWEPVVVETKSQQLTRAQGDIEWLDVASGEEVLMRRVQLRGGKSDRVYARAISVIRSNLIPEEWRSLLLAKRLGIGELIRDCGLETYRELLEINREVQPDGSEAHPGDQPSDLADQVYRTYRIVLSHAPAILVTEYFPVQLFEQG